ncbi:hypothetical protein mhp668 [Mesomycoplasma hyopneumoniae 232]|uniref:Uncharacterized protein n=1 Tax=Mesomycoplasma hyopneumoniae (strain 232) TaxID=295358 RepID=Q5ZZN9_MESH2|nr:hypothetical protein mhp668 [Mesomycoplasma hyopneumoniae 232]
MFLSIFWFLYSKNAFGISTFLNICNFSFLEKPLLAFDFKNLCYNLGNYHVRSPSYWKKVTRLLV